MAGLLKKHPYIVATLIATILAIVVWMCVPKEYTAITKLSDEYKEIDLAIGLNDMKAHIKNLMNNGNAGMNDMAVYCKILKTEDFARKLSHKKVPNKNMTYGEYLAEEDTIENILDHINYNYSSKQETLTISFTDKDPVVAAQMLDSITAQLQLIITRYRQSIADASLQNAERNLSAARLQYEQAQKNYASFVDTHIDINTQQYKQQEKALDKTVSITENLYQKATEEYARQKALKQRSYMSFAVIQDNSTPQKSSKYFIGYLLSFIIISLLVTHGFILYKRGRKEKISFTDWGDIFSPWSVSILIWLGVLGFYYLLNTDLYPITRQFYYCLIIWLPIFCICSYLTYYLQPQKNSASIQQKNIYSNQYIFNFFFIVSLIITPLYVYKILQIVLTFSSEDLMNNIRTLAVHGEGVGFLSYSNVINQSLFVVAIWSHPKVPMWKVITLALACILNSLAIMEKGTIFFVFICIMFVLFEKKKIKLESIAMAGILLLAFFYFFNLARSGEDSDYQKNETLLDFFAMYALSPPVAFCQLLPEVTQQFGTNTFESIYLFLRRYGADVVVKEKLQEFVFVPIPTNVYTMFQPFFIDFGYKGIAFFAAIYGTMSGYFYRLFRNANSFGKCIYTYIVNVLILQFYQENIFLSLVFVLQFTFFVYILTQERITISFHQQPIKHAPEHE